MKKVILDENLPHRLRHFLAPHEVVTVKYRGWSGLKNGDLVERANREFNVLVTGDTNLRYQQNLSGRKIAILELPTTVIFELEPIAAQIVIAISGMTIGGYRRLSPL